jgi:hypothetical protein
MIPHVTQFDEADITDLGGLPREDQRGERQVGREGARRSPSW